MNYYILLIPVACFGLWLVWKIKTNFALKKIQLEFSEKLVETQRNNNSELRTENETLRREADLFKFLILFLKEKDDFEFKKTEERGINPEEWVFVTTQNKGGSRDIEIFSIKEMGIVAHGYIGSTGLIDIYSNGRNKIQFKGEYPTVLNNKSNQFIGAGYGTVLMQKIIEVGKAMGLHRLHGHIMETDDKEHEERMKRFYRRLGFTILLDGDIELIL
jgi:RimJ/RimL family protein N-acetyltransferase